MSSCTREAERGPLSPSPLIAPPPPVSHGPRHRRTEPPNRPEHTRPVSLSPPLLTMAIQSIQQYRYRRLSLIVCTCWAAGNRLAGALLLSPPTSTSTSAAAAGTTAASLRMVSGTGNRQSSTVQLPSGRFAACWPIGLGSYNGGPAVFLANKRRILDPREEVFPIPVGPEAVPLLSEASECACAYNTHHAWGVCVAAGKQLFASYGSGCLVQVGHRTCSTGMRTGHVVRVG